MKDNIPKRCKRFSLVKEITSPTLEEFNLPLQEKEVKENMREYVGALQWAVTVTRPDVARSVNALSRSTAQKCADND